MAYKRKTRDVYILMSNYGYGYDEEVVYDNIAEARADLKVYRENCPHMWFYIKKKREHI